MGFSFFCLVFAESCKERGRGGWVGPVGEHKLSAFSVGFGFFLALDANRRFMP